LIPSVTCELIDLLKYIKNSYSKSANSNYLDINTTWDVNVNLLNNNFVIKGLFITFSVVFYSKFFTHNLHNVSYSADNKISLNPLFLSLLTSTFKL